MANAAYTSARKSPARARSGLADLVQWLPCAVMVIAALVELALANRKYGLFTGGFGQSRAVDTMAELLQFLIGYSCAMVALGLAGWAIACAIARRRPGWVAVYIFALINGGAFCGLLAAQFQLHSYLSDAAGFALIRQLGGGSLVDALKYALSEISIVAVALAFAVVTAWLLWKLLLRLAPVDAPAAPGVRRGAAIVVTLLLLALSWAIPRGGSDAAFGLDRTLAWHGVSGVLNWASDVDRDGYGLFAVQADAAPLDPARHPLALDIPGNHVDEDGYGGDLALVPLPQGLPAQVFDGRRPHVVLVALESVRFDVLGKRCGGHLVAPNLAALVAQGGAIAPAYSHVGFTTESLKSIFTGQLAPRLGEPSLFRDFKASGYRIGVYSGQPADFGNISTTVGMRESADVFIDAMTLQDKRAFSFAAIGSLVVPERYLLQEFDRTLGAGEWTSPHFLYFNFQSAHFPYNHEGVKPRCTQHPLARREIGADRAAEVQMTYWNAVAEADAWLGEVVARLKARGAWEDTILLVTGDHGEDLFEAGFLGHGHVINGRQNATMLVANRPGMLPSGPVGLADYRSILVAAIRGDRPPATVAAPFMHIGPLDRPTAIGLAQAGGRLTSLRLDTGEACFVEQQRCQAYTRLADRDRERVDALIARWGSERWRDHQR